MTTTTPPSPPPTQAAPAEASQRNLRSLAVPAWAIALLMLGAVSLATAWHRWPVTLLFAATAAVPLLLVRGALRAGMSRWFTSAMLVLLALMAGYLATANAELSLSETVRDTIPRLLTSPQPYLLTPELVVGPLLLTAFVSMLVGLRVESRHRVEPVIGSALLYVAGALLTAGASDPWGLIAIVTLVVALWGWVLLDEHSEPARNRLGIAGPVTVVCVGALAALATFPLVQPFEPRTVVDQPVHQVRSSNPLVQLTAWANNPNAELLRVRGDDVPLRLVVLDAYDGTQWTTATTYSELSTTGATGLDVGPYRHDVTVEVQFNELGGPWLPSPGTPLAVGLPEALVDLQTGTLYNPDSEAAGAAGGAEGADGAEAGGVAYEVQAAYDDPPAEVLDSATVSHSGMERYLALPDVPNVFAAYAAALTRGTTSPYRQALLIEREIKSEYAFSSSTLSGSALWRLNAFLFGEEGSPGARVGTSEQFATAFAVVARLNGLPTRVVVGFKPGEAQDDGTRVVRGADAFAWAEVYFDGVGWVPFSPTPDDDDPFGRDLPDDTPAPEPVTGTSTPTLAPDPDEPGDPETTAPQPSGDGDGSAASPGGAASGRLPLAGIVSGGVVLVLVLGLWGARRIRSWRHRRRGPVGTWADVVDALHLAGHRPSPHDPADVVAQQADERWQTSAASAVAAHAQHSAFGPPLSRPGDPSDPSDPSGSSSPGSPVPASAEVRRHAATVRRLARRSVPWWRRWWWWLDPRVLFRR